MQSPRTDEDLHHVVFEVLVVLKAEKLRAVLVLRLRLLAERARGEVLVFGLRALGLLNPEPFAVIPALDVVEALSTHDGWKVGQEISDYVVLQGIGAASDVSTKM